MTKTTELAEAPAPTINDLKSILLRAKTEIDNLRRVNQRLSDKMEMVELFQTVLFTTPSSRGQGYGEDVSWIIERAIAALNGTGGKDK